MKKITSFVLAMLFILTLLPAGLTASAVVTPSVTLGAATKPDSYYYFTGAGVTGSGIKTILISFTDSVTSGDKIAVLPASSGDYSDFTVSASSQSNDYTKRINISTVGGADASLVQSYIRGIGFTIAGARQTVSAVVTTDSITYDTFYNIDTQHYYQYIPYTSSDTKKDWLTAYTTAKGMSFMGRTGYLATIKTEKEDKFVNALSDDKTGWLGGTRLASSGVIVSGEGSTTQLYYSDFNTTAIDTTTAPYWYWACGPEIGQKFFNQATAASENDYTTAKPAGSYVNWATESTVHEPNNDGNNETCLTTLHVSKRPGCTGTSYSWNDIPYTRGDTTGTYNSVGYFVEYGDKPVGSGTPLASVAKYGTGSAVISSSSYTATVNIINKAGSVELRVDDFVYPLSGSSGTYTASVPADTYEVYVDGVDTGKSLTVASDGDNKVSITYITGTPVITGDTICGQTLTATIPTWTKVGTLSYQWTRDGSDIGGATGSTYTLIADDFDKTITVKITDSGALGSVESAATSKVVKATSTPAIGINPVLSSAETSKIILVQVPGYEYTKVASGVTDLSAATWQDDNTFTALSANTSYDIYQRLKETGSTLASSHSEALTVTTCPAAITNLSVKSGDGSAVLNWTAAVGADGYKVYQREASGSYGTASATVAGGDKNTCTLIGLENGKTYYFIVKPYITDGTGDASNEVSISALDTPTGLGWSGSSASWTAVTNATAYKIQLYKDGVFCGSAVTSATASYDFSEAIVGAGTGAYTFKVTATASGTAYSNSAESSASSEHGYSVAPDASSATINYRTETVSYDSKYEVTADTSTSVIIPSAGSISAYIANYGVAEKKLYIRVKQSGSIPTSGWTEITVKARPETPTVFGDTSVISYDYSKEQIIFGSAYEVFTTTSGGESITSASTKITPGGTLNLRAKATDNTFSSDWATITVPARPGIGELKAVLQSKTGTSITLDHVDGAEYSKDGGATWQGSNEFKDLTPNTEYPMALRYAATTTTFASAPTSSVAVRTKASASTPDAPVIVSQTAGSITINTIVGYQYAITDANASSVSAWSDKVTSAADMTFTTLTGGATALTAATQYKIWVRVAETADSMFSDSASCLGYTAKATPVTGEGYSIDYTAEKITVSSGYEVSKDSPSGTKLNTGDTLMPGTNYYVRKTEDSSTSPKTPASDWATINVPARPDNSKLVAVKQSKTGTSITLDSVAGAEYSKDGGKTWQGSNEFKDLTPNTEYTMAIRYAAKTGVSFASEPSASIKVKTKALPAMPAAPVIVSQTAGSITINTNSSYEYSITVPGATEAAAWETADGSNKTFSELSGTTTTLAAATQYKIWVRVAEAEENVASAANSCLGYTAKATPAAGEGYSIDYTAETITVSSGYEVSKDSPSGTKLSTGDALTPGTTYYVRKTEDSSTSPKTPASDWATINMPSRPLQPAGINGTDETVFKKCDGTISKVTEAMEYKLSTDKDSAWTSVTASQAASGITGLPSGTYLVRYKAVTESGKQSFKSLETSVVIAPGSKITVTFDYQGGSSVSPVTDKAYGDSISAPTAPTKTGFYFGGWYTDNSYKTAWSFFSDKLTSSTTLLAKWNAVPTYTVRGSAIDDVGGGNPVVGATVILRQGNKQYGPTALTDIHGNFEISNVEAGIYNLVVKKDDIEVITKVEVINCDLAVGNVTLPSGKASSALIVNGSDTPDVVVGGLNTEANKQFASDKSTSTVITLTVEEKEEKTADKGAEVTKEVEKNGKLVGMLLQIDISKYTDNVKVSGFNETSDLIELIIPLETALQGKENYCVYRSHEDSVSHIESIDTITKTPNSDKEYFEMSADGKSIILHVKKFSTYALAYSAPVISSMNYTIHATAGTGGSISPSACDVLAGGSKTFTVTANSGYSISKVLVDGVNVGAVTSYTFSNILAPHTIEAVFTAGSSAMSFKDVSNTDWFYDAVNFITNAGLMKGTDASTFSPDLSTTRGMIITIIYRLEGEPSVDTGYTFKDVAGGDYYDRAVAWGAKNGIIKGFDADTYGPKKLITREQLAAIFDRYATFKGYDVSASNNLSNFADASQVSGWALGNVQWAVAEGLMTGTGNNMLSAGADSTRAQAATMFKRFIEKHTK